MHDYPTSEIERSPAASAIGRLASASALGLFHFEHRARLETPDGWLPPGRADLATAPTWTSGVLPESKYQGFRHDLLIGSYHPGHRAKWTAHELCHGLVGFAWRPDASPFFMAVAARLAEALPVGLWYYLDEVGLRRCPRHAGGGALYGAHCRACEISAAEGMDLSAADRAWSTLGAGFVEREIDAALRSADQGEMVSHRLGNLDLASDGVAYAGAHGRRLASPEFARFASDFFRRGEGLHEDLESLAARVREVLEGVVEGSHVTPLEGDADVRIAQDIGWRLLTLRAEMDGEAAESLDAMIDDLAQDRSGPVVQEVIERYADLHAEYEVPDPDELFAVGYTLAPGIGQSRRQVRAGLETACPRVMSRLGAGAKEAVEDFVSTDGLERSPLGKRFAGWARRCLSGELADLAALEAALAHPRPADAEALALGGAGATDGLRLDTSVVLLALEHDALEDPAGPLERLSEPLRLACRSTGDGEVELAELEPHVFEALEALSTRGEACPEAALEMDAETIGALRAHGILVPDRWSLTKGAAP